MEIIRYVALAVDVLAVAVNRPYDGGWCAYAMAVQGINHDVEYPRVAEIGDKLPERVALAIFPEQEGRYYVP